jgi:hypothetical protein
MNADTNQRMEKFVAGVSYLLPGETFRSGKSLTSAFICVYLRFNF